jgi:hypothetical protein
MENIWIPDEGQYEKMSYEFCALHCSPVKALIDCFLGYCIILFMHPYF